MPQKNEPIPEAKTSIDSLLELLKERGKMDLNSVSISLGVSPMIIEEWAKVLESGKLIKIDYEVGKMYLEPLAGDTSEAVKSAAMKMEAQRLALLNEMEVERISLDKYSKNLEDLSTTVAGMEGVYRQKLPEIQKLFTELDSFSNPMMAKTKELESTQKSAEAYFSQLDAKIEDIYGRINAMGGANIERVLKQKEEVLKVALSRADSAKATLLDLEDTKQALFSKLSSDIDLQVREFKGGLKASINQIYNELKADAAAAVTIDKEIRTELAETSKIAAEAERLKKEAENVRASMLIARNSYKDKYQKLTENLGQASKAFAQRYVVAEGQLEALKASMGEVAKLHDALTSARTEIAEIQKTIAASDTEVDGIIAAVQSLNTLKDPDDTKKPKAMTDLNKRSLMARLKGERIKKSVNDVTDTVKSQSQSKPAAPPPNG